MKESVCPECKNTNDEHKLGCSRSTPVEWDEKDMIERIRAGEFENKVPYPSGGSTKDREVYRKGNREAEQLFKEAALEEVGLSDHPKADKVFEKAWRDGHSSGYAEVFGELQELSELML